MTILFNNPLLYLIDHPAQDALEILDKRSGRMGLVQGLMAARMRNEFDQFLNEEHDQEEFEAFIDTFEGVLEHSATLH